MWRRMLIALVVSATAAVVNVTDADEPGWTAEERAALSMAVFDGKVKSVGIIGDYDKYASLTRVEIQIANVAKGADVVGKDTIALYFLSPGDPPRSHRCPSYVELKEGQSAKFYVRLRKIGAEWRAFLDMGSDVELIEPEKSSEETSNTKEEAKGASDDERAAKK